MNIPWYVHSACGQRAAFLVIDSGISYCTVNKDFPRAREAIVQPNTMMFAVLAVVVASFVGAAPARADNAALVQSILANFNDNNFVTEGKTERELVVYVGNVGYLIQHVEYKQGKFACVFTESAPKRRSQYLDLHCDGKPDGLKRPSESEFSFPLTKKERGRFPKLLQRASELAKITHDYKKNAPQAKFRLFPDFEVLEMNYRWLQELFNAVHATRLATWSDDGDTLLFHVIGGDDQKVSIGFAAGVQGKKVVRCTVRESQHYRNGDTLLTFADPRCNGTFPFAAKGENARYRKNTPGNEVVVNAILQDLAAFAEFAAKHYPR